MPEGPAFFQALTRFTTVNWGGTQTFADLAKLVFASSVVGFFIPGSSGTVSLLTFLIGAASASGLFMLSIAV
jgi:hypothetical protein